MGRGSQGIAIYDQSKDTCATYLLEDYPEHGFGLISTLIDDHSNLWLGTPEGLRFLENPHRLNPFNAKLLEKVRRINLQQEINGAVSYLGQHEDYLIFGSLTGHGFLISLVSMAIPNAPAFFSTIQKIRSWVVAANKIRTWKNAMVKYGSERTAEP